MAGKRIERAGLVRRHAGFLDDAGIFAAFRGDEGAELLDRHRLDFGAGVHQLLADSGSASTLLISLLSLAMIAGGVARGANTPAQSVKSKSLMPALSATVGTSGAIGERLADDTANTFSRPLFSMRQHRRHSGKIEIDVTADQIGQGGTGTLVGHMREIAMRLSLEKFAGEMARRAGAGRREGQLLGAQGRHEFRHGGIRRLGGNGERQRHDRQHGDRRRSLSGS